MRAGSYFSRKENGKWRAGQVTRDKIEMAWALVLTELQKHSRLSAGSRYKFLEKTERSRNRGSSVFTRESWGCYHQRKSSNE